MAGTGSVSSAIGGGPTAYWQNGQLVLPGAPLTGGVAAAAAPAATSMPSSGLVQLAQSAPLTGYAGTGGVSVAPSIAQNSVVNNQQTYAPDVKASTTNNITNVPNTIPGLPSVSMPSLPGMSPMQPMQFADFIPPPAPQGDIYNSPALAYAPPTQQVPTQAPQAPAQASPSGDLAPHTQRSIMSQLMHPFSSQKELDQRAAKAKNDDYNRQEIERYYQANPQAARPAPAVPTQDAAPQGAPASLPNGVTPKDPWDYSQGPPQYPVSQSPYAHPKMAAIAAAMGPRSAALYLGAMNGQQHRNDKMFDAQNAYALERMKQDTELEKARMTEKGKGALSMEQAMNQADKIRAMPDGPQKFHQLIRLEAASMASGLGMSFADIITDGQDPESAAKTKKVIADAASSQADAFKKVETAATEVAAINRENQMKMSKAEDYYATREGDIQGKMSRDHADVLKDQEQSQTFADRVAQAHQQTLQGGLNLQKTGQEIASNPLMQAEKAASTAVAFANAAAMSSGPLKAQLEQEAAKWRAQSQALLQNQQGQNVQLPIGQSPVQGVDGPLIGRDGKVVMHQNTQRMPVAPTVQGYNGQGAQVPAPPNMPAYMAGGITQQAAAMPPQGGSNIPPPPNLGPPPPAYPGQQVPTQNAPMAVPPPAIALAPAPKPGAVLTDPKVINGYLQAAGGDPNKATELAQSQGWKIPPAPKSPQAQQKLQQKVQQQAPQQGWNPFAQPPAPTHAPTHAPTPTDQGPSWQDRLLEWTRGETPEQKETVRLMQANAAMRARAAQVHEVTPQQPSRAPVTAQNPRPWNDQGILPHPAQAFPGGVPIAQAHNYPGGEPVEPGRHIRQVQNLLSPIPGHIMDGTTGKALAEIAQSAAHRYGLDQAFKPPTPPLQYFPGAEPIAQHNFPGGQSVEDARRQSIERQLRERALRGDKKAQQLLARR